MVDEYFGESRSVLRATIVQIPLWSMNTRKAEEDNIPLFGVQIPLWSMNTVNGDSQNRAQIRSDSSMVDEYEVIIWTPQQLYHVQIPLWSMNTSDIKEHALNKARSDSSMVDEYIAQNRFPLL